MPLPCRHTHRRHPHPHKHTRKNAHLEVQRLGSQMRQNQRQQLCINICVSELASCSRQELDGRSANRNACRCSQCLVAAQPRCHQEQVSFAKQAKLCHGCQKSYCFSSDCWLGVARQPLQEGKHNCGHALRAQAWANANKGTVEGSTHLRVVQPSGCWLCWVTRGTRAMRVPAKYGC